MSTRTAVVTGATSGIGAATATALARHGFSVTIVGRDADRTRTAAEAIGAATNTDVEHVIGDLGDLASTASAADELARRLDHLDVLVNNAGIHHHEPATSHDGLDLMAATNHFGPFVLTTGILDLIAAAPGGGRIVSVASEAHRNARGFDPDTYGEPVEYGFAASFGHYAASKLATILFTSELAARLDRAGSGTTASCCCPGMVATGLLRHSSLISNGARALSRVGIVRTPERGAQMTIRLATEPADEARGHHGEFRTSTAIMRPLPGTRASTDPRLAERLWARSEQVATAAVRSPDPAERTEP